MLHLRDKIGGREGTLIPAFPQRGKETGGARGREIADQLGYRNVSSVAGACRRGHAATKDRRFAKALDQLRESL